MAFERPITVKEAVDNVHSKKYLLPAIQREVVWSCEQIEMLFDSLMRDYPIGSFLFWYVLRKNTANYQFYEFMRDYSEWDNYHNIKASVSGQEDVTGVLDGQQRLTSLYIGLRGSYAYKEPRKRWDNPSAYPVRRLHLNLRRPSKNEEAGLLYDFVFLTDEEAKDYEQGYWFPVGKIFELKEPADVNDYLLEHNLMSGEAAKFSNRTLFKLHEVVHTALSINYFLERDESLEKVLQIFIRVNSGGTPLSYSDLLLSVASAQWKDLDAREEIHKLVDDLNAVGDGFAIHKDMVLKSCLVLSDFNDIAFRVDNFNKANMLQIEKNWREIARALHSAVELVGALGFNRQTLTSNYALIPIAYFLLKGGLPKNFHIASQHAANRKRIQRWLISSLVKRTFGGSPDTVLTPTREILGKNGEEFPLDQIRQRFSGTNKSLDFTEADIENVLESKYGDAYTFSTLALLYPSLDFANKFHIDHIYPRSGFGRRRLIKQGVAAEKVEFFMTHADLLPNLQLLEGVPNQEKSDTPFVDWFNSAIPDRQAKQDYRAKHYIPETDLSLTNFEDFFKTRRELLKEKLRLLLSAS